MIDPFRGILLGDRYYNYVPDSYKEQEKILNDSIDTQFTRTFTVQGLAKPRFTIAIHLENQFTIVAGSSTVGTTFWMGNSRLADLKTLLGATSTNMPITFVAPTGCTYQVVPTGTLDTNMYRAENPGASGSEFISTFTLESI